MPQNAERLAQRLGVTCHESVLRRKLERLRREFPSATTASLEDWLMDVANTRGARVILRPNAPAEFAGPPPERLNNEELVCGICQVQCLDRPQMLRLAAQLISRGSVQIPRLCWIAKLERVERVLASLAQAALRVEPTHAAWNAIQGQFRDAKPLRDVLLHWTRLAEPVMQPGRPNATAWKLAA